jgi:hypothetical protein
MTACHAIEIILTRPATHSELRHARRSVRLAANADRTRLMSVQRAHSAGSALHVLRHQLSTRLPIDVLTTHYPDGHGQVLLNVTLGHGADRVLRRDAAVLGQRPQDVLRQRVTAALAREEQNRARSLKDRLEGLFADHTPEEVLVGVASCVRNRQHHRAPTTP